MLELPRTKALLDGWYVAVGSNGAIRVLVPVCPYRRLAGNVCYGNIAELSYWDVDDLKSCRAKLASGGYDAPQLKLILIRRSQENLEGFGGRDLNVAVSALLYRQSPILREMADTLSFRSDSGFSACRSSLWLFRGCF